MKFFTIILAYIYIVFILFNLNSNSIFSLPPYISIEERVKESNLILVGDITILKERSLFQDTKMVTLIVKKEKILKNALNINIPDTFFVYLNIYPETFENKLKFVPEEGKYIIFLNPVVKDQEIVIFKLYKEEPFALQPWSMQIEEKILFDIKNKFD